MRSLPVPPAAVEEPLFNPAEVLGEAPLTPPLRKLLHEILAAQAVQEKDLSEFVLKRRTLDRAHANLQRLQSLALAPERLANLASVLEEIEAALEHFAGRDFIIAATETNLRKLLFQAEPLDLATAELRFFTPLPLPIFFNVDLATLERRLGQLADGPALQNPWIYRGTIAAGLLFTVAANSQMIPVLPVLARAHAFGLEEASFPVQIRAMTAFLTAATGTVHVFRTRFSSETWQNLRLRIWTWWWILGIVAACLATGPVGVTALYLLMIFFGTRELAPLAGATIPAHRLRTLLISAAAVCALTWTLFPHLAPALPIGGFALCTVLPLLTLAPAQFLGSAGLLMWLFLALPFALSTIIPLADKSTSLVLSLLIFTGLNDVGQYIFGKLFGKHRVAPSISPAKTWEGLLGGVLVSTTLSVVCLPRMLGLSPGRCAVVGISLALGGFIGDLMFSALKRSVGIKDFSNLLPGHGGMLDRIDSLCLTSPLFLFFLWLWEV